MQVLLKTRDNCVFCDRAKQLLSGFNITYEEQYAPEGQVPQIFVNGAGIGGYTDLVNIAYDEDRFNSIFKEQ